jgi:glutathione-specific gamma-glutamylcyclotransferase
MDVNLSSPARGTHDPFVHLPQMRARITPPEASRLRITREVLAGFDKLARQAGYPANWRHSDAQIEASWRGFFADWPKSDDIWVFGYGSLMWDPGFHFAEVRLAEVDGFQRRFTLKAEIGRGAPGRPALMLSLEPRPGRCAGLTFRIPAETMEAESVILWRREMIASAYAPQLVPITTPQGWIRGLAFTSNPASRAYVEELPLSETAAIIAAGAGALGTNRDYLEETAAQLQVLEIEDPYLDALVAQVRSLPPPR